MEAIRRTSKFVFVAALVALASLRLAFFRLLWSDEDYHLAAALGILRGKVPYRDFWYDKPPLAALYYLLIAAAPGALLRVLDALYVLLACWLAYRLARDWWSESEGLIAALLLAFFLAFYLPAAVIPFAPDALLLAPHLAAIYFARQGRGLWAGVFCGIGFCVNVKAAFVLAVCGIWLLPMLLPLVVGCVVPVLVMLAALALLGALPNYLDQVWLWGFFYAAGASVPHPLLLSLGRIFHWLGFHAALAAGALAGFLKSSFVDRRRLAIWLMFSFAAVCFGNHFAPRYFLQILPPLAIVAARGIVLALASQRKLALTGLALLLLIPFVRFAPRYGLTAFNMPWSDIALDVDSRQAADRILALARPGDTLFVWGYRPDIYVYTRLLPPGLFWDSQPLTGVPADRHLTPGNYPPPAWALDHWQLQQASRPTFVVDGLGLLNSQFNLATYPPAKKWLENYVPVARTKLSVIYKIRGS